MLLLTLLLACGPDKPAGDGTTTSDGGSADGGATDGGATDGGATDGGVTDGGTETDGGTTDGGTALGDGPRCALPARPPASAGAVALEPAFPELRFDSPIAMAHAPGDDSRWWVVEQDLGLSTFSAEDPTASTVALDLSDRLFEAYEGGALGLALDPDFATNGHAFVVYMTGWNGRGYGWHLARFTTSDGGLSFDPDSELAVLDLDQPYENHNGGALAFGPDGYLYVSLGDGGSGGDPLGHGQDPTTLFGTILRLDVSGATEAAPYAVPDDNPFAAGGVFAGQPGREEIYAWGLRNAWSMHFDLATGELWAGDVGQSTWEEVDRIELGGNYGWNTMEGEDCYGASTCDQAGLLLPEVTYGRSLGVSITGGVVYRGERLDLQGSYLYGDFGSGRLWALVPDPATGESEAELLLEPDHNWSGFAQDTAGEVYLLSMYTGRIYTLAPAEDAEESDFPAVLSATGCVDPEAPTEIAAGLLPYEVAHPFWSDGADKGRWLSLPEGAVATVGEDGDLALPAGSVVVKEFLLDGQRFETRLLAHHEDGSWAGYSYRWREDGTDADLLSGSVRAEVGDQGWHYPSRAECRACHTDVAGISLGLELAQLGEQAETWRSAGLLDGEAEVEVLAGRDDPDLDRAARSYLHANCAMCHQPDGPGGGSLDLRWGVALADTGLCGAPAQGDLGLEDARIVAPGQPERSVLLARLQDLGAWRMPPVGSLVVDEEGVALLTAWIEGVVACD